ncbi:MAG: GIY-YIG nuclease family protein [Anaerolineae bacterium]|nr:GIY-YIG nuclease family protein [Anaerolineae bacterium]
MLRELCNKLCIKMSQMARQAVKMPSVSKYKTMSSTAIKLIHSFATPDMRGIEKHLHTLFAGYRQHGEWFALDTNAVEYIRGLA